MPQTTKPFIFTRHNLPPVELCDASNKPVDVYGWKYNEETRQPEPVLIGQTDPDADIQAARTETLTEMMARMPGKNPLQRLQQAVDTGIIVPQPGESRITDLRGLKPDLVDNLSVVEKGTKAYQDLGLDKYPGKTAIEKLMAYFRSEIEKSKAPAPVAEGEKHE